MREINAALITETVKRLCIESNCHLSKDIKERITDFCEKETWPQASFPATWRQQRSGSRWAKKAFPSSAG